MIINICAYAVCVCAMCKVDIHIYMQVVISDPRHTECSNLTIFTTEGFFEVALERGPEWDLKPRRMNSVQTL